MNIFFRFKIAEIGRIMDVEFTSGYRKGAKLKADLYGNNHQLWLYDDKII